MNPGPVFVAGLERSGTSLIFALLGSHPNIAMTRRTNLWTYFYNQYGDLSNADNFERCLDKMMRYKRLVVLEPDPDRLRKEFWQGEPTYGRLFALLEMHHAERLGKERWGDKSLNTERYAEPIFEAYPSARILHMVRDPRDRYASVLTRWKVRRGGVGAGTAMWLTSVELARQNVERYPDQYRIIRYETLAAQPEETLREICDFMGEKYASSMLTMQGAASFRDDGGNSSYGQRTPGAISTDSIGRYRQILSKSDIAFIESHAGREMSALGYESGSVDFDLNERLKFATVNWPLNVSRMYAWRVRHSVQNQTGRSLPDYRLVGENTKKTAQGK